MLTYEEGRFGAVSYSIVEELDFITNYDIKYRMGLGGEDTEKEDN